ncbi:hypothetical protein [Bacillus cereus]|uniref:hypothetical protein n=1 Tax=Bacillus cereus TaxID=1396 RepID=UPI003980FFB8
MQKIQRLFSLLFLVFLLCACQQSELEESESEDSKVMDIVMNTINNKDFLSVSVDDKKRIIDLEIANTVHTDALKKRSEYSIQKTRNQTIYD